MDEQRLFRNALDQPPDRREAWLNQVCGADQELKQRIEALIQRHDQANHVLEQPAPEMEVTPPPLSEGDLADSSQLPPAAGHSVLESICQTFHEVPRVVLPVAREEGDDPVARAASPEMPGGYDMQSYRLEGEIARGGMGAILKGRDTDLGRDLAIKVLLESHKGKQDVVHRFIEEAQIGGQLQHPGIAPVYELGQFSDERPFFTMKLVKGETLAALLADREDHWQDRGKLLGIFEQVCQTMAYAHSRSVIHRDLKPANIMVGAFGEVQVMDWGLAKVLSVGGVADERKSYEKQKGQSIIQTLRSVGSELPTIGSIGSQTVMGSVLGTPAYMPPEQALGEIDNMDERADVFALGAMLCEILTGLPPYAADDGEQIYRLASRGKLDDCFERLEACNTDADLIALNKHCLELEPGDRPRDAGVLAKRFTSYLESVETKLREAEMERAIQAARVESETARAEAEAAEAEAERQRAGAESQAARRLKWIVASLTLAAILFGLAAVQFRRFGQQQQKLAQQQIEMTERRIQDRAKMLVDGLMSAEINRAPDIVKQMATMRGVVDPLLQARRERAPRDSLARQRLALTLENDEDIDVLQQWLYTADVDEFVVIRDVLRDRQDAMVSPLLKIATDKSQPNQRRFRAACGLAAYAPDHAEWSQLGPLAADRLLQLSPFLMSRWMELLEPVKSALLAPLAAAYREPSEEQHARRDKATAILLEQFANQPQVLADLLVDADSEQFPLVLEALKDNPQDAIDVLERIVSAETVEGTTEERVAQASRQANAAVALLHLGKPESVWRMLRHTPRPDARSFLIHRIAPYGVDPKLIVNRLNEDQDVSARRALILCLSEYSRHEMGEFQSLLQVLLSVYREDPDPGVHSAVAFLLMRWFGTGLVDTSDAELVSAETMPGRRWYVTDAFQELDNKNNWKRQRTFALLPPATIAMGDLDDDASPHRRRIDRAFAISTHVVSYGSWGAMAEYCNKLSKAAGIPPDQWCYEQDPKSGKVFRNAAKNDKFVRLAPDYLSRTGYRMATAAEWEYACRAGAITKRYYGDSDRLLDEYAWHRGNSTIRWPYRPGFRKPNDFGLFDMLGNQKTPCVGRGVSELLPRGLVMSDTEMPNLEVGWGDFKQTRQPFRGSTVNEEAELASASRGYTSGILFSTWEHGYRVVRTLPLEMCRTAFGEEHPAVLGGLYSEAVLAACRGDEERADALDRQLLEQAAAAADTDEERWSMALRFAARLAARRDQHDVALQRCDQLIDAHEHDLTLLNLWADMKLKTWEAAGEFSGESLAMAHANLREITKPLAKIGAVRALRGETKQAAEAFDRALASEDNVTTRREIVQQAMAFDGVVDELVRNLRTDDPVVMVAVAQQHADELEPGLSPERYVPGLILEVLDGPSEAADDLASEINNQVWYSVRFRDAYEGDTNITRCNLGLIRAVSERFPTGTYANTQAFAEYRLGNYEQAIAAALISLEKLPSEFSHPAEHPTDLAVLTLSHLRSGDRAAAEEYRSRLEENIQLEAFRDDEESRASYVEVATTMDTEGSPLGVLPWNEASDTPAPPSAESSQPTFVLFENQNEYLSVWPAWVDGAGQRKRYGKVAPGESKLQWTHHGHTWSVEDASKDELGHFVVGDKPARAIISKTAHLSGYRKRIARARDAGPEQAPQLASLLAAAANLALVAEDADLLDFAEQAAQEAYELRQDLYPDDHESVWLRHNAASLWGEALLTRARQTNDDELAVQLLEQAQPLLEDSANAILGDDRVPTREQNNGMDRGAEAAQRVVELYEAWQTREPHGGHESQAAKWRKRLEELPSD